MFESVELGDYTKRILSDNEVSEDEYMKMINFLGKQGWSEIKDSIPFFVEMSDSGDYNTTRVRFRKMEILYNNLIDGLNKFEEVEDYFVEWMDDRSSGIEVIPEPTYSRILFNFKYTDLSNMLEKLAMIDNKFKRSRCKYNVVRLVDKGDNNITISIYLNFKQ